MHHSLDTYAIIKRFTGAGIKENQAHEIVSAIVDSKNFELNNLVTKSDLKAEMSNVKTEFSKARAEVHAEFAKVRAEMQAEFADVRAEMRAEFADVRAEMRTGFADVRIEIEKTKNDILKWIIGLNITTIIAMIACFKLLLPK